MLFVLDFAMVFTMVIVHRAGVANATDDATGTTDNSGDNYTFFDTTETQN